MPGSPSSLKKRLLRTVLKEIIADTTAEPPTVLLKLHWVGGSHTELIVRKNKTGHHDHVNSEEITELIRELALVSKDVAIVGRAIVPALETPGRKSARSTFGIRKASRHVHHRISGHGSRCNRPLKYWA